MAGGVDCEVYYLLAPDEVGLRHLLGTVVQCILGHGLSQVREEIDKRPF